MDLGVKDQGYIIVGGSKGMGLAVAELLAANGANIAIISRNGADAAAAALASKHGVLATSVRGDATESKSIDQAIAEAVATLGGVVGLVTSNAERRYGGLLDSSDADWLHAFESLVMGTVRCCRAVVPHMIEAGGGSIVTLGAYSVRSPKSFLSPTRRAKPVSRTSQRTSPEAMVPRVYAPTASARVSLKRNAPKSASMI